MIMAGKSHVRASSIFGWLVVLAATAAPQTSSHREGTLLARVPDGLTIARELLPISNRGTFVERSALGWSADGRRVAYAARRGDEYLPVVGADVGKSYGYVSRPILAGAHAFFSVARRRTESTELWWLWVDGTTLGPEDWMGDIGVSRDGRHVAYWTHPGAKVGNVAPATSVTHVLAVAKEGNGGRWSVSRGKKWFGNALTAPLLDESGQRVFTCGLGSKGWVALRAVGNLEAELSDPYPMIDTMAISPSGSALAFVKTNPLTGGAYKSRSSGEGTELYFHGKRVGRDHERIAMPMVDALGQHVAYVVDIGEKRTVALDDEKNPEGRYDHVLEIAFDPRSRRLAFVANVGGKESERVPGLVEGGEAFVVIRPVSGSAEMEEHPRIREARDLVWDSTGERLAYCARDESGWRIACGSTRSGAHEDVGPPNFAEGGRSIAFGSRDGRELWWRVLALP